MDLAQLPPRPDPITGEPRPPQAPGSSDDYSPPEHAYRPGKDPDSPTGQGPMLEYYRLSKNETLKTGLAGLGLLAVGTTIATKGQWIFYFWPWLIVVVTAVLIGWNVRGTYLAAGADWLQSRRHWVRIYELASIKYTTKPGGFSILLQDGQGGRAGCDLHELQSNPALWDLVYNGILHSVASREVTANFAARRHLPLPDELSTKLRKDNGKTT